MRRVISLLLCVSLLSSSVIAPVPALARQGLNLPAPGSMVALSSAYVPVLLKGIKVHPQNPLLFDFIIDSGQSGLDLQSAQFKEETQKLIRYFLASLTIKEDDLWVNLSPYEKDRIIPDALSQTELGRDMLAQDYLLKQITASLIYPEKEMGKNFWDKIYRQAREKFGTTDVPVDTFNKVWIIADKAKVLERNNAGYVVGAHLKVMLEEDYVALSHQKDSAKSLSPDKDVALSNQKDSMKSLSPDKDVALSKGTPDSQSPVLQSSGALATGEQGTNNKGVVNQLGSKIVREIIIPALEQEVNEGKNFASLRQMYYAMILAAWYKLSIKDALLNRVYSNKSKTAGILSDDPTVKEKIYQQYLEAFKRGVFNYIKEDIDAVSQETIPRKYFSGGERIFQIPSQTLIERSSVLQPGESLTSGGPQAQVSVQMDSRQGEADSALAADTVFNSLKYGLRDVSPRLSNAVLALLLKARDAFEPGADSSKVRREFDALKDHLQKELSEDLQQSLNILIADFNHALVVWLLPHYGDAQLFKDRSGRLADISTDAAIIFLGILGVHGRNKLDAPDEQFYASLVFKTVQRVLDETMAIESRKQASRALINGLAIYADDQKYREFLRILESDPRLQGRFKEAVKVAFNWNPDLTVSQNSDAVHPIFSWFANQSITVWLRHGLFDNGRTLQDVATASGTNPFETWPGMDREVLANLRTLEEFSGDQPVVPMDQSPLKEQMDKSLYASGQQQSLVLMISNFLNARGEARADLQKQLIDQGAKIIPIMVTHLQDRNLSKDYPALLETLEKMDPEVVLNELRRLAKSPYEIIAKTAISVMFLMKNAQILNRLPESVVFDLQGENLSYLSKYLTLHQGRTAIVEQNFREIFAFNRRAVLRIAYIDPKIQDKPDLDAYFKNLIRWVNVSDSVELKFLAFAHISTQIVEHLWDFGFHLSEEGFADHQYLPLLVNELSSLFVQIKQSRESGLDNETRKFYQFAQLVLKLAMDARLYDKRYIKVFRTVQNKDIQMDYPVETMLALSAEKGSLPALIESLMNTDLNADGILKDAQTQVPSEWIDQVHTALGRIKEKLPQGSDVWGFYAQAMRPVLEAIRQQAAAVQSGKSTDKKTSVSDLSRGENDLRAYGAFPTMTDARKEELMGILLRAQGQELSQARRELIQSQDQSLIPPLLKAVETGAKAGEFLEVLSAIVRRGDDRIKDRLLPLLNSRDPLVVNRAAEVLGKVGDATTIPAIIKALKNNLAHLTVVLENFDDPQVIAPLMDVIKRKDFKDGATKIMALQKLRQFDDPRIKDLLVELSKALNDSSELSRKVIEGLGDYRMTEELIRRLDAKSFLNSETIAQLRKIGDAAAIPALFRVYERENLQQYKRYKNVLYADVVRAFARLVPKAVANQRAKINEICLDAINSQAARPQGIAGIIMTGDLDLRQSIPWDEALPTATIIELFENMNWEGLDQNAFDGVFKEAFERNIGVRQNLIEAVDVFIMPESFNAYVEQLMHWLNLEGSLTDRRRMENYGRMGVELAKHLWYAGFHREKDRYLDNEALTAIVPPLISAYMSWSKHEKVSGIDHEKVDRLMRLLIKLLIDARLHDAAFINFVISDPHLERMSLANHFLIGTQRSPGLLRQVFAREGAPALIAGIANDQMFDAKAILGKLKTISDSRLRETTGFLGPGAEKLLEEIQASLKADDIWSGYQKSLRPILEELQKQPAATVVSSLSAAAADVRNLLNILAGSDKEAAERALLDLIALNRPESAVPLIELSKNADSAVRWRSVRVLNAVDVADRPDVVDALILRLRDSNPEVSRLAAKGLGSLGDRRAVEPLMGKALTGNEEAIEALGKLKDRRAGGVLLRMFLDSQYPVSKYAAVALGRIGGPEAVQGLAGQLNALISNFERMINEKKADVSQFANQVNTQVIPIMVALRQTGDAQAIESLIPLEKSPVFAFYSSLRAEMISALTRLVSEATGEKRKELIRIFQQSLNDVDPLVGRAAAAGIIMTRETDLITDQVIERLFKEKTVRILMENILWSGLAVDYFDPIFRRGFKQVSNAQSTLESAFDFFVDPQLFQPFVIQMFHWLELREGPTADVRLENWGRMGILTVGHVWRFGLEMEDGRFLDNEMLADTAGKFVNGYFQWVRQADLSGEDARKYNLLLRLIGKLMADGRTHNAEYVGQGPNHQDLARKNIVPQFIGGSPYVRGVLSNLSVREKEDLGTIIQENQDIDSILNGALTIQDVRYKDVAVKMVSAVRKALEFTRKKTGDDVWEGYDEAIKPVVEAIKKQTAALNAPSVANADTQSPGGIDLSSKNLDWDVTSDGTGVEMKFDPAVVAEFERGDFSGVFPVILRITPISSPRPLLGLDSTDPPALASL
ncbi:MAG: HEAT repeat domain-containing protein [Candidatus Omnitrophica bacterium]|nr:HEAT repeat domain-containing protein [Candidatus Omnitrophota bacterium]